MELQLVQQQLKIQLEQQLNGKVIHTDIWCVPIHTYEIRYQPVQKKSMDILMKILLFSFQKSTFANAEELSEILLVEPLFVEDLIGNLRKNGLIDKEQGFYQLTEKGRAQFSQGVYEEVLEPVTVKILYSPVHGTFFEGDIEKVLDYEDFPEKMYRYLEDEQEIDKQSVLENLRGKIDDKTIVIKKILSVEHIQTNELPCIEFIIEKEKNEKEIRVWNTLEESWDKHFEKQLSEKE